MAKSSTKKTTASKPAKKVAKKAAKKATTDRRAAFAPTARIVVKTKDNPRRPGTPQFTRYATILKFNGKTVEAFKDGKGDTLALRYAVDGDHVAVK